MAERIIPALLLFVPAAAIGCWITWAVKRSRINDVAQSWMREARIESTRKRLILAIILTVVSVVLLIIFLPGVIRDSKAAAAAAESAAASIAEATKVAQN